VTLGDWNAWIGRSQVAEDVVTPRLIESFRATLTPHLAEVSSEAPLGLHWRPAAEIVEAVKLGNDGHPARGSARSLRQLRADLARLADVGRFSKAGITSARRPTIIGWLAIVSSGTHNPQLGQTVTMVKDEAMRRRKVQIPRWSRLETTSGYAGRKS
jgi:hypothetical protein